MARNYQPILKLLLALAIPTVLIGGFLYAQKEANMQLADYQVNQKEHPAAEAMSVENYEMKEIDATNQVKWHLQAAHGIMIPDTRDVDMKRVTMKCYEGDKVKLAFTAPSGVANEVTHLVTLDSDAKELVHCEGANGSAKISSRRVELKKNNQFTATGGVTIVYPGVAKVTGNEMVGSLEKSADLKNFKITGNTHTLLGKFEDDTQVAQAKSGTQTANAAGPDTTPPLQSPTTTPLFQWPTTTNPSGTPSLQKTSTATTGPTSPSQTQNTADTGSRPVAQATSSADTGTR